jgi:hypothetical protein
MPRLSNLNILKRETKNQLSKLQNRFDPRTFASLNRKIDNAVGISGARKIANDITLVKLRNPTTGLTGAQIRALPKITTTKIKELKTKQQTLISGINKPKKLKKTQPVLEQIERNKKLFRKIKQENLVSVLKSSKLPRLKKMTQFDKIRFYEKIGFEYNFVNDEKGFYEAIKDALRRFPDASSLTINLYDKINNKASPRHISLIKSDLETYETFKEALNRITSGNFSGSDAVDSNELDIVYTNFSLSRAKIKGDGSSEDMIFSVYGIEQSKRKVGKREVGNNDCAYQCLLKIKELGEDIDLSDLDINKLRDLEYLIAYITQKDLKINIITNSFTLNNGVDKIIEKNGKVYITVKDKRGNDRRLVCSKFEIEEDIKTVYLHYAIGAKQTIIYDEVNQHYDVIKDNKIVINDDVYLSCESKVIKNNKILFTSRQVNTNSRATEKVHLKYVFFDYETVIDFDKSSCMREYSLSILSLSPEELRKLTEADEKKDEKEVQRIRRTCCETFLGYDCSIQFIKWILKNQMDTAFVFVGFNNANFDNFILLDALLRYIDDDNNEFSVSDIFYNGSQLLNFYMCGRHNTFDIHKHLMGSLKSNCESFKINCCAKKSFDHNKAQQLYLNGELINFITDNEELKEYNEYDVLATAVLFQKYKNALYEIEATKNYSIELHSIKTVGSLIYKVFEESKKNKKFNLPKLSYERYTDLQKSKIAGRVELFNGVQKVEERLVSTDVCSLYPYVMSVAPVYYPCGEMLDTDKYMGSDVIGFYYCDIDQSNLRASNLPKIYAKKTDIENDWGHEEVLENYLISNVMIELLKRHKCKVVIKKGFYFTEKKKSCDMFDFLLDFMSAKNEQDTKKKNKDETYNPALRETLKLLMNSLSGKVIEGLHTEKTSNVDTVDEYMKIKDKSKSVNFINAIGNKIFITYEVDGEQMISKQRPIYLGVLIYDYAKSYMYDYSYSKVGLDQLLYTDTDASKFRHSKFIEWKKWVDDKNVQVPHWEEVEKIDERYKNHRIYETNSKVFGSFEDELEESIGTDYVFYCLEKKSWCYAVDGKSKFRFKGLNGSALLLSLGENFIKHKTIKHKSKEGKESWDETKYYIEDNTELEVYNFAQNNKNLAIENNNELKFFEQIYSTGEAYLLCSSFRKIVKNSAHNVELGNEKKYNNLMNKIQVNYMMKHINLYKK